MNPSPLQGNVSKLAFGGEGIVKNNGQVVFIPFTAPGDRIAYELTQVKKNFAFGKLAEILNPSPLRQQARCPYFTKCGGCQLQHLPYDVQAETKAQWVVETLQRIGQITPESVLPIVKAPQEWNYRRHITLTLKIVQRVWKAGYTAVDQDFLPVEVCPIFLELDHPLLRNLQQCLHALEAIEGNEGRAIVMKTSSGAFVLVFHFASMPANIAVFLDQLQRTNPLQGLRVEADGKILKRGDLTCQMQVENLTIQFSPQAFVQNYPEQSLKIYQNVRELASSSTYVLDLYCGIGISSLLLAQKGHAVTGIESNPLAIEYANRNKALNQLSATFLTADVKNVLTSHLKKKVDLLLVNPPRIGLDPSVVQQILKAPPERLIYISCMPSTLARDLKLLSPRYHLKSVQAFDMFPQTYHVETLALLERIT